MKFINAKRGDKVYCLLNGDGEVVEVTTDPYFPINVCFGNASKPENYNLDGKLQGWHRESTLYWSKPEIIEPKRPIEKVIEGFVNWYGENDYKFHPTEDQAIRATNVGKNVQTVPCKLTFTITE